MRLRKSTALVAVLAVALPLLVAATPQPLPVLTEKTKVRAAGPGSMLVRLAQDTTFSQPRGTSVPFAYDVDGLAAVALVQADAKPGDRLGALSVSLGRHFGRATQYQMAVGVDDWQDDVTLPAGRYWLHTVSDGERVNANVHVPTADGSAVFSPSSNARNTVIEVPNELPADAADGGKVSYTGGAVHELRSDGYLFGSLAVESSHAAYSSHHLCVYDGAPQLPFAYLPGCPSLETDAFYIPAGAGGVFPGERFRVSSQAFYAAPAGTHGFGGSVATAGAVDNFRGFEQFALEFVPQKR